MDPVERACSLIHPDPSSSDSTLMSSQKNKWYGGIVGGTGCVYGIPFAADRVIKIDPLLQRIDCLGNNLEDMKIGYEQNWHGGLMSKIDGSVWGFPANSNYVVEIRSDDNVVLHSVPGQRGKYQWGGMSYVEGFFDSIQCIFLRHRWCAVSKYGQYIWYTK